jgi:hypothetical protein
VLPPPASSLQETLEYFANPDNLNSDVLPPGLADWDPSPYLASAIPIAASVLGVNFLHEVGHRIAAYARGVKLGPTYFVPNLQVGGWVQGVNGDSKGWAAADCCVRDCRRDC